MMKRRIDSYFNELMPLFVNGRLGGLRRRMFAAWLRRSASGRQRLAAAKALRQAVSVGPDTPSAAVWNRIRSEIQVEAAAGVPARPQAWHWGMGLAVLLIILAWFAFPPSVVLEWSVQGSQPEAFHVYRSTLGTDDFQLLEEIPAVEAQSAYRFVDLQLIPGRQAVYKIEAIRENGVVVTNELVVPDGGVALPNQLALLLSGGVLVYGLLVLAGSLARRPSPGVQLRTG